MTDTRETLAALAASTSGFLAALDGLSAGQWNHRPAPGRWSIGETAEHTAVVLRSVERLCTTKILAMPLAAGDPARRMRDGDLARLLADRARAIEAPEMVRPKGRWATREEFTVAFTAASDGLVAWARTCTIDLRTIGAPHPLLGSLDALQWIEFASAHTERHAKQVEDIRRVGGV